MGCWHREDPLPSSAPKTAAPPAVPDLGPLLNPAAVAILGASSDPSRIGGRPLRYMLEAGFAGPIYPINPNRDTVQGLKAYPSIGEAPGPVDCAIVALPAALVADAVSNSNQLIGWPDLLLALPTETE